MPKAAGWSVAVGETTSRREEAVTAGVGRCLLFLEASVDNNKKTAPLGATKFEKVDVQLDKVQLTKIFSLAEVRTGF